MFTGIIEEKGKILKVIKGRTCRLDIQSRLECRPGDSIAVQGICLTVAKTFKNGFAVEAMVQTRGVTTLDRWKAGDLVNLERALKFGDRVGGHFLLGHVDEVGKLVGISGNNYKFQVGRQNAKYMVPKGSIAVDGVSLTIAGVSRNFVSVALVPYTLKNTTLERLKNGSFVNIEYDYLVKSMKNYTSKT